MAEKNDTHNNVPLVHDRGNSFIAYLTALGKNANPVATDILSLTG